MTGPIPNPAPITPPTTKMVNGVVIPLTPAEVADILAQWTAGTQKDAADAATLQAKQNLIAIYGKDPIFSIDKICQHLGIDYTKL